MKTPDLAGRNQVLDLLRYKVMQTKMMRPNQALK